MNGKEDIELTREKEQEIYDFVEKAQAGNPLPSKVGMRERMKERERERIWREQVKGTHMEEFGFFRWVFNAIVATAGFLAMVYVFTEVFGFGK